MYSTKKKGPMIALCIRPSQTFTFGVSLSCITKTCGFLDPQIRQLCLFIIPLRWKVASSLNSTFWRNVGLSLMRANISLAKASLKGRSFGIIWWSSWILYARNLILLRKMSWTVDLGICSNVEDDLIDVRGVWLNKFRTLLISCTLTCFLHAFQFLGSMFH